MAGWPQHHTSHVASRAMERWRFLAHEGLAWSRRSRKGASLDVVEHFSAAYRRSATELARVKAFSPDRDLADYIESAVANAHFAVHKRRRPKLRAVLAGALITFPVITQRYWAYHLLAAILFFGSGAISYTAVMVAPHETYNLFISAEMAQGRDPSASTESLRATLGGVETDASQDSFFTSLLFTNNTRVAFFCFAFGIVLGLPTMFLLVFNGLPLGAMTALHVQRGLGVEWFAWILPHGVPELGAIVLCGGAGLALGHRLLNPGNKPRKVMMQKTAIEASIIAMGCVPLLALAGLIEGVFRQTHASTEVRYLLFTVVTLALVVWFAFARLYVARDRRAAQA